MVVNASLALPQFSSTAMRRLISKRNSLDRGGGGVTLCKKQGGVERHQLSGLACRTSTPLDVCGDERSSSFHERFKFPLGRVSHLRSLKARRAKVLPSLVKFPGVVFSKPVASVSTASGNSRVLLQCRNL